MSLQAIVVYRGINNRDFCGKTKWRVKWSNINGRTMKRVKNEGFISKHNHFSMAVQISVRIRAITRNCIYSCDNWIMYVTNKMLVRNHSSTTFPLNFRSKSFAGTLSLQDLLKRNSINIVRISCSRSYNRRSGRGWYQIRRNDGTQLIKTWRGFRYSGTFL